MLILIFIELLLSLLSCYYLILNCSSSFKLFKPFSSYSNLPNLSFSHSISTFPKFTRFTVSCCLSVETLYEVLATITIRCLRKLRMLGPDTVVSMEIGCWPSALSQTQKTSFTAEIAFNHDVVSPEKRVRGQRRWSLPWRSHLP